jgi:GT2 family glycosyltransferase
VRGSLYAGGGSALFRKALLEIALAECGDAYDPVYWEDAEWGVRARKRGFRVLFCPESRALHVRRATVNRFYTPDEVARIFERNRLLFHMRNVTRPGSASCVRRALAHAGPDTLRELLRPAAFWKTLAARFGSHLLPFDDRHLNAVRDERPVPPHSTTL